MTHASDKYVISDTRGLDAFAKVETRKEMQRAYMDRIKHGTK